jgi:septal ring-binding cell division protein DamX
MNRFMTGFNFLGIFLVAILCIVQWSANSRLSHDVDQLDQTRVEQEGKLADQDQALKQDAADLDEFRHRLSLSETDLKQTIVKLTAATTQRDTLIVENKQIKSAMDQWIAAVNQRDAALKQAGDVIQKLAIQRNDAIQKFNDLADKYNNLVKGSGNN